MAMTQILALTKIFTVAAVHFLTMSGVPPRVCLLEQTVWYQPLSRPRCCWFQSRLDTPGHQTVPTVLVMRGSSEEGHFLHPPRSQPGFLEAKTMVTCEPPMGLNFNRSVAWSHGALKEKSHARQAGCTCPCWDHPGGRGSLSAWG